MPTNVLKHQDVESDSSKELLPNAINAKLDQSQLVDVPKHSTETPGNVSHVHSALDKIT
jgi:non-homologous end joining protein Ku